MAKFKELYKYLLVFAVAVAQYWNTAGYDYAWDDAIVLTENTRVQKGWKDIPELFKNIKSNETEYRYGYRPIALLSFATDVQFFGMNPKAAHKTNILLYGLLCALILYFLNSQFPNNGWPNVIITILFAVHPLHSEVVANIKSRDEILAMIFGLGGLLAYRNSMLKTKWFWYLLSASLMILAFWSKESAITFVGVAFLLAWYSLKQIEWKAFLRKMMPVVALLVVLVCIRVFVYSDVFFQNNDLLLRAKGMFHQDGFVGNPLFAATWSERIATAIFLVAYFAFRMVSPLPLVHDYSYNQFPVMNWGNYEVWLSGMIFMLMLVAMVIGLRKRSELGFGIAFFLITTSIYLHLAQIAPDIFGERFTFVPSLGIGIALLSLYRLNFRKMMLNFLLVMAIFPLSAITWKRNLAWKDNDTLLKTDLPNLTNCVRANYNYALFLHRQYYTLPKNEQAEASLLVLHYYEHTMALTDRLFNVYLDLGGAYMEFGRPEKAKVLFEKAIVQYPDLSAPYVQMGKYYMSFKDWNAAIPYFEKALHNGAMNSDYHYLLAICQFNTLQHEKAIETLLDGEKLGVSSSAYHSLIARLFKNRLMYGEAKDALERGLKLYPNDPGLSKDLILIDSELKTQRAEVSS